MRQEPNQKTKKPRKKRSDAKPEHAIIGWTKLNRHHADAVVEVVESLRDFWPLTLRQIYYRLVAKLHFQNKRYSYQRLSQVCSQMRLDDIIPWSCMEDRTRRVTAKRGFDDMGQFIEHEQRWFLKGYRRDIAQSQHAYVEVWCEKDALTPILDDISQEYGVRTMTCKGFNSHTLVHDFAERGKIALSKGQTPTVIYLGDHDPSGMVMFEEVQYRLEFQHKLPGADFRRIALNHDQIERYDLPISMDPVKSGDTRAKKYLDQYGQLAVELDALSPDLLQTLLRESLEDILDISELNNQREIERQERIDIEEIRQEMQSLLTH